jgi:hypothetical protein
MSGRRVTDIAREDPLFPRSLPSAGTDLLWLWAEVEPYFRARDSTPTAWRFRRRRQPGSGSVPATQAPPAPAPTGEPDLVNAAEIARRAVTHGFATTMSRQRISVLARKDPEFPAPWPSGGVEQLWSWSQQIRPYLAGRRDRQRAPRSARRPARRLSAAGRTEQPGELPVLPP